MGGENYGRWKFGRLKLWAAKTMGAAVASAHVLAAQILADKVLPYIQRGPELTLHLQQVNTGHMYVNLL